MVSVASFYVCLSCVETPFFFSHKLEASIMKVFFLLPFVLMFTFFIPFNPALPAEDLRLFLSLAVNIWFVCSLA